MLATQQQSSATEAKSNLPQKSHFFQPKLSINQPNDVYEQEADSMADRVMRMPDPFASQDSFFKPAGHTIQRKCAHCEQEDKMVHRKESSTAEVAGSSQLDSYISSLSTAGRSLSATSRQFFEPRFGHNFSNVRIHTDPVAAKSAESINALAYTTGNNIVFNSGQYSPETATGKRLMAHELTHVVQQGGSPLSKVQRAEKAPGCVMVSAIPSGERYNFVVNTDNFAEGEEQRLTERLATISATSSIDVLGMASAEGPEANNVTLSCQRAHKVAKMVRGSGHAVGMENATGGYPGSAHDSNYRAVALNIQAAPIPCDTHAPVAPPPGPFTGGINIPLPIDPHIPSGSLCRGACGPDCPSTCTHEPDIVACLPDSTGTCHFTFTYRGVLDCGSHLGCRVHDACYDHCMAIGDPLGCHRGCDIDCVNTNTFSLCNGWRQGLGPFDSRIQYANPPIISGPITGPCPP